MSVPSLSDLAIDALILMLDEPVPYSHIEEQLRAEYNNLPGFEVENALSELFWLEPRLVAEDAFADSPSPFGGREKVWRVLDRGAALRILRVYRADEFYLSAAESPRLRPSALAG
jgi:hypothetical protein